MLSDFDSAAAAAAHRRLAVPALPCAWSVPTTRRRARVILSAETLECGFGRGRPVP